MYYYRSFGPLLVLYTLLCPHFRVSYSLHNLITPLDFFFMIHVPHSYVRQGRAIYNKKKDNSHLYNS